MNETFRSDWEVEAEADRAASEPWFFGQPGEELFGWLHGSAEDTSVRAAAVLCGTLGAESATSHRALRVLADSLAEYKIPTLRFDYSRTGDSVDPEGAFRFSTCVDNVRSAIQLVRAQGSVDRIFVVGVRLGALLAVKAAELEEVSGLVLWGPVTSGKRLVREWSMISHRSELSDGLASEFLDELSRESLLPARPLGSPAFLVVEREELAPEDKLVGGLQELGFPVDRRRPGGFLAGMIQESHLAELPVEAIREIREWIADSMHTSSDGSSPPPRTKSLPMTQTVLLPKNWNTASARVRERFLNRDETGGLFGVVSEPAEGTDANGQCIILLNSGSIHHVGPNRMYVEFARRLAAQGSRVCRADLGGLGDSPARLGSRENDPYPASALDDVGRLVRALRSNGDCPRIVLVGLCSGAWAAFHGGLTIDGITDLVLINPDFYGERSVVGKPPTFVRPKDFSHYRHSARSWVKWRKFLTGRANYKKILRVLRNQAALKWASWKTRMAGGQHRLDDDLTRLAVSGVRVGFIYSPGDGGFDFLRMNGRSGLERLRRSGLLREVTIEDSDHAFMQGGSQARLGDTLSEWLRS
jgi:pimeloyl-ACP methyl ester carboxylesterase